MERTLRETSVAASVVVDMLQYLEARGAPAAHLATACGIDLASPPGPDDRVPGGRVEWLWGEAVRATGDPLVGLHMAEAYSPGALDIVGYVVMSCRTIGEVLDRLARYAAILNDGLRVSVERHANEAWCRCHVIHGVDNYLLRDSAQAVDTVWVALARELGRLPATPLRAREVWFRRPEPTPGERREYERVFGTTLRFGATEDRFVVPRAHLEVPLRSANPALLASFERLADATLASVTREGSRAHEVARVLAERIKGTVPSLGEVARAMAMSDRSLQRALRADGTSYQQLIDAVRRDLALRHLANPATSAGQVGFLLGFSEPAAFHRAFRRWTGKAPGEFRARA